MTKVPDRKDRLPGMGIETAPSPGSKTEDAGEGYGTEVPTEARMSLGLGGSVRDTRLYCEKPSPTMVLSHSDLLEYHGTFALRRCVSHYLLVYVSDSYSHR